MLLNSVILLSLTGHVIGDFYLQSEGLANEKNEKIGQLLFHSLIYSVPFVIFFLFAEKTVYLIAFFGLLIMSHLIIDFIKFVICNSDYYKRSSMSRFQKERLLYLFDQALHILIIIFISIYFVEFGNTIKMLSILNNSVIFVNLDITLAVKWALLILCIYKPSNVTFVKIFSEYKPDNIETNVKKVGAIIGLLERILIVILINIEEYSAIGLILTAKSIARYDSVSKDQEFAEYYLIGTLTSVLLAILFYLVIFIAL